MNEFFYGFSGVLVLFFGGIIILAPVLAISIRIGFQPFAKRFDAWLKTNDHDLEMLHLRLMETEAKLEHLRSVIQPQETNAARVAELLDEGQRTRGA